ncbi:MAG: DNA polymerase III subunit delta [Muribaculaceae bacterium]|nr:DNA polymerase III subunit delta [Muribaculaceae bacterium]
MAKKESPAAEYTHIISEIRAGRLAPVYLLCGLESYYIDRIAELLAERVVPDVDARDFNVSVFFGAETNIKAVADAARRFPVMSERQLIMLKEAQTMDNAKARLEELAPYFDHLTPGTVLLIVYRAEPLKASSALVKAIKKAGGIIFESPAIKDWMLPSLISDYCKEKKVTIDSKSVEMLRDFIGVDLSRLFGEIDKLRVAGNNAPITPELIEKNVGISKDFNNFELLKAISSRNYSRAMRIADYFARNPKQNPVIMTTSILFKYFSQLMLAHYSLDKTDKGLMAQLGLYQSWQLNDIKDGMRNFRPASVLAIIHALRVLDCRSKGIGSMQKDTELLKQFIYEAFTL